MRDIAVEHPSLDTYARMLFFKTGGFSDSEELIEYKALISCFFLLLQSIVPRDQRYDLLLASILALGRDNLDGRTVPILPDKVRFLVWNYDVQIERSLLQFVTRSEDVYRELAGSPKIERLNGCCAVRGASTGHEEYMRDATAVFDKDTLERINTLYKRMVGRAAPRILPDIHFAWERDSLTPKAAAIAEQTQILVVIGYSFPYFNRSVDSMLLERMASSGLERVHLQVGDAFAAVRARIAQRLGNRPDLVDKISEVPGTDEFFVPNEFG